MKVHGSRILGSRVLGTAIPPFAWLAAVVVGLEPAAWASLTASLLRTFLPDALLFTAAAAIVLAPVVGVSVVSAVRAPRAAWLIVPPVLCFTASSALLTWLAAEGDPLAFAASSHVAIASVTLALAALGGLCGAAFDDPLDASACSLIIALTGSGAVLGLGATIAAIPRGALDLAMLASPLVSMASAAHIDLVRLDLLYQISPLAHLGVEYPGWASIASCYLAAAAVMLIGIAWMTGGQVTVAARRALHTSHAS